MRRASQPGDRQTILTRRQIREIEDLVYRNVLRDRFGLKAVADGVSGESGVDFAVGCLGELFLFYFLLRYQGRQERNQGCNLVSHRFPNFIQVHCIIGVDQFITHSGNSCPGSLGIPGAEVR